MELENTSLNHEFQKVATENSKKIMAFNVYLESTEELLKTNRDECEKLPEMESFISLVLNKSERHEAIQCCFDELISCCDRESKTEMLCSTLKVLDLAAQTNTEYAKGLCKVYEQFLTEYTDIDTRLSLARCMGNLGSKAQSVSVNCIQGLSHLSGIMMDKRILNEVTIGFYNIGNAWSKKKEIYPPLLGLLEHPDAGIRISCIKAIKTQLEGYWEKPVSYLMDMTVHDKDLSVRTEAAMALGDAAEFGALSIRESIYELIDNIGKKVVQIKKDLIKNKSNKKEESVEKYKLKNDKEILKILYHYAKIFKYRLSR